MTAALAELERVVRFAQVSAGVIPEGTHRPALPHEIAAGVNFPAIARLLDGAYLATAQVLDELRTALAEDLGRRLAGREPGALAGAIVAWSLDPGRVAAAVLVQARARVADILGDLRHAGRLQLLAEATFQGVDVPPSARAAAFSLADAARDDAAALPVSTLMSKVQQAALAVAQRPQSAAVVQQAVEAASLDAAYDSARQGAHVAFGAGREDAADELPEARLYASELLDLNTCYRCEEIDGYVYAGPDEAYMDYPHSGPYRWCKGGGRCRGTLVFVWEKDAGLTPTHIVYHPSPEPGTPGTPEGGSVTQPKPAPKTPGRTRSVQKFDPAGFDAATTPAELRTELVRWAKPGTTISLPAEWAGVPLEMPKLREAAKTVGNLYAKYPQVRGVSFVIDVPQNIKMGHLSTIAECNGRRVTIRHEMFMAEEHISHKDYLAMAREQWWHIVHPERNGIIETTITHEFGHAMHWQGNNQIQRTSFGFGFKEDVRRVSDPYLKGRAPVVGRDVSRYGYSNHMETVAEAFADVEANGSEAYPLSKVIYKALTTKPGKRIQVGPGQWDYAPSDARPDIARPKNVLDFNATELRTADLADLDAALARAFELDHPNTDRIIAEIDRREAEVLLAKQKKALGNEYERNRRTAIREAKKQADWSEIQRRIGAGADPRSAVADVTGVSVEKQLKAELFQRLKAEGVRGSTLDLMVTSKFKQEIARLYVDAEDATRGHMLTRQGEAAGIDAASLFSGPEARARKWASDELKQYWDTNGRLTEMAYRDQLITGVATDTRAATDFLQ